MVGTEQCKISPLEYAILFGRVNCRDSHLCNHLVENGEQT